MLDKLPNIPKLNKKIILLIILLFFILLIILTPILFLLSPFILLGFIFQKLFDLINNIHRRNKNFQFDLNNLQNV